jgi:hypothetical protein
MPLNKVTADSIQDSTVVASDIADGTITLAKLQSGLLPSAIANSGASYANAAFATANTGTASGSYANSAFAAANTATASGSYANSAFTVANNSLGIDTTQNTNISSASSYANSAFTVANNSLGIDTTQNTNISSASSYANAAFTKANTAGVGTVTSVATGNGLSGGTITTTGTLVIAAPSYNSVGSYVFAYVYNDGGASLANQGSYAAGAGARQVQAGAFANYADNDNRAYASNNLSGTWRNMGGTTTCGCNFQTSSLFVRVS